MGPFANGPRLVHCVYSLRRGERRDELVTASARQGKSGTLRVETLGSPRALSMACVGGIDELESRDCNASGNQESQSQWYHSTVDPARLELYCEGVRAGSVSEPGESLAKTQDT